ncbi:MAG: hypothetical protein AAF745_06755 [Planctomycetota bacterium]
MPRTTTTRQKPMQTGASRSPLAAQGLAPTLLRLPDLDSPPESGSRPETDPPPESNASSSRAYVESDAAVEGPDTKDDFLEEIVRSESSVAAPKSTTGSDVSKPILTAAKAQTSTDHANQSVSDSPAKSAVSASSQVERSSGAQAGRKIDRSSQWLDMLTSRSALMVCLVFIAGYAVLAPRSDDSNLPQTDSKLQFSGALVDAGSPADLIDSTETNIDAMPMPPVGPDLPDEGEQVVLDTGRTLDSFVATNVPEINEPNAEVSAAEVPANNDSVIDTAPAMSELSGVITDPAVPGFAPPTSPEGQLANAAMTSVMTTPPPVMPGPAADLVRQPGGTLAPQGSDLLPRYRPTDSRTPLPIPDWTAFLPSPGPSDAELSPNTTADPYGASYQQTSAPVAPDFGNAFSAGAMSTPASSAASGTSARPTSVTPYPPQFQATDFLPGSGIESGLSQPSVPSQPAARVASPTMGLPTGVSLTR